MSAKHSDLFKDLPLHQPVCSCLPFLMLTMPSCSVVFWVFVWLRGIDGQPWHKPETDSGILSLTPSSPNTIQTICRDRGNSDTCNPLPLPLLFFFFFPVGCSLSCRVPPPADSALQILPLSRPERKWSPGNFCCKRRRWSDAV